MATHSSILTCRIPQTEEPGGLQSMGSQESHRTQRLNHHRHHHTCQTMRTTKCNPRQPTHWGTAPIRSREGTGQMSQCPSEESHMPCTQHLSLLSLLTNTITGLKGNQKGHAQLSTNLPQIWKTSLEQLFYRRFILDDKLLFI